MKVFAQLVGIGTPDSPPCVMVVTDNSRFLFNVGEGLQRFCMEHKLRLVKLDNIFFTQLSVDTCGGLPGMLLTLADMGRKQMKIHGPAGIIDYMYGFRNFMRRDDVALQVVDLPGQPGLSPRPLVYPDVTITPVCLFRDDPLHAFRDEVIARLHSSMFDTTDGVARPDIPDSGLVDLRVIFNPLSLSAWPCDLPTHVSLPHMLKLEDEIAAARSTYASVACYIIETQPIPGKFFPEKAAQFGIPKGPAFGKLSKGQNVQVVIPLTQAGHLGLEPLGPAKVLADGSQVVEVTITPAHVKDADVPGQLLIIVDVPDAAYMPSLLASTAFETLFRQSAGGRQGPVVVYHFCPEGVWRLPEYQAWVARFTIPTQHVRCNGTQQAPCAPASWEEIVARAPIVYPAQTLQLCKLHVLNPQAFPIPFPLNDAYSHLVESMVVKCCDPAYSPLQRLAHAFLTDAAALLPLPSLGTVELRSPDAPLRSLALHNLVPVNLVAKNPDMSVLFPVLTPLQPLTEMCAVPGMTDVLRQAFGLNHVGTPSIPSSHSWPGGLAVTFTGTSSAIPSKYRNVSGIFVESPPHAWNATPSAFLLDGGEGTYGQLFRRFSGHSEDVSAKLSRVSFIWISHMHADHHLGIMRVLKECSKVKGAARSPILVAGPSRLFEWLLEVSAVEPSLVGAWRFVDAEHFLHVLPCDPSTADEASISLRPDVTYWKPAGSKRNAVVESAAEAPSKRARVADEAPTVVESPLVEPSPVAAPAVHAETTGPASIDRCMPTPLEMVHPVRIGAADDQFLADLDFVRKTFQALGVTQMKVTRVQHCYKSYAIKLQFVGDVDSKLEPWSLLYSGDTRPCQEVVALSKGAAEFVGTPMPEWHPMHDGHAVHSTCSVMIHEATFDDADEGGRENAQMKKHSTVDEACAVAEACDAAFTLLTHFSARYPKVPTVRPSGDRKIVVGYDLMTVNADSIHQLPDLLPALHTLFVEEQGDSDAE